MNARANAAPSWMDGTAWRRTDAYTPTLAGTHAERRRRRANAGLCTDTSSWTDAAGAATPHHHSLVMQFHLPFFVLSQG